MENVEGNLLIIQCDPSSCVGNAVVHGVIMEALNHECIEEIYGGLSGINSLLRERFVDLAAQAQQSIRMLGQSPGNALGYPEEVDLAHFDWDTALKVIKAHNVRYLILIGSGNAFHALGNIHSLAKQQQYAMQVMHVPDQADNSLYVGDHTLGYGTTLKTVASKAKLFFLRKEALKAANKVQILHLPDCDNAWIAAGASLLREEGNQVPHILCIPEIPFDHAAFRELLQDKIDAFGTCLIVTTKRLMDSEGSVLAQENAQSDYSGGLASPVAFLTALIESDFGKGVELSVLAAHDLECPPVISKADHDEAILCGQDVVRSALKGASGKTLGLLRRETYPFKSETSLISLEGLERRSMPESWLRKEEYSTAHAFVQYTQPLLQGEVHLPYESGFVRFAQMGTRTIKRSKAVSADVL